MGYGRTHLLKASEEGYQAGYAKGVEDERKKYADGLRDKHYEARLEILKEVVRSARNLPYFLNEVLKRMERP